MLQTTCCQYEKDRHTSISTIELMSCEEIPVKRHQDTCTSKAQSVAVSASQPLFSLAPLDHSPSHQKSTHLNKPIVWLNFGESRLAIRGVVNNLGASFGQFAGTLKDLLRLAVCCGQVPMVDILLSEIQNDMHGEKMWTSESCACLVFHSMSHTVRC